jgi:hypothetical protein
VGCGKRISNIVFYVIGDRARTSSQHHWQIVPGASKTDSFPFSACFKFAGLFCIRAGRQFPLSEAILHNVEGQPAGPGMAAPVFLRAFQRQLGAVRFGAAGGGGVSPQPSTWIDSW